MRNPIFTDIICVLLNEVEPESSPCSSEIEGNSCNTEKEMQVTSSNLEIKGMTFTLLSLLCHACYK